MSLLERAARQHVQTAFAAQAARARLEREQQDRTYQRCLEALEGALEEMGEPDEANLVERVNVAPNYAHAMLELPDGLAISVELADADSRLPYFRVRDQDGGWHVFDGTLEGLTRAMSGSRASFPRFVETCERLTADLERGEAA